MLLKGNITTLDRKTLMKERRLSLGARLAIQLAKSAKSKLGTNLTQKGKRQFFKYKFSFLNFIGCEIGCADLPGKSHGLSALPRSSRDETRQKTAAWRNVKAR